jgi:hypothetical protein
LQIHGEFVIEGVEDEDDDAIPLIKTAMVDIEPGPVEPLTVRGPWSSSPDPK